MRTVVVFTPDSTELEWVRGRNGVYCVGETARWVRARAGILLVRSTEAWRLLGQGFDVGLLVFLDVPPGGFAEVRTLSELVAQSRAHMHRTTIFVAEPLFWEAEEGLLGM